ncbi:hypothetical protein MAM1_0108c05499 [Mucor ambiguus]|uniref:Uncharacterized protein n=1 Tax=Mucor ambiguus TaxID=91626 RepID=A0A0C9MV62_9FUNG|nr:hypothetical protein MAM1_0108c05499 [Mucor ambiguus]
MEEEYDYSMYTTVCTITICPVSNVLSIRRANNRISEASSRYASFNCLKIPLEFYYNKESGNIIYGDMMIGHYKQYPPHEKYVQVSNFVEDLYALYQHSRKGESTIKDDPQLCSAISCFLTKLYPDELSNQQEAFTTQYAFILPSHKYTNKIFVDDYFRPLLRATPWLTLDDASSKTVFTNRIDTLGHLLNGSLRPWLNLKLQREEKYFLCNLQKVFGQDKLLVSANFIRAVYDPDLIAASGRSMTALGGEILLSTKLLTPPLIFEIPISPAIDSMNNLAKFLSMKVFTHGDDDLNHDELDDYTTDREQNSLMRRLIRAISTSNFKDQWSQKIEVNQFSNSREWRHMLSDKNKRKLSQVTYMDILEFFSSFDMSSLGSSIMRYLNEHNDEEGFQSILTFDEYAAVESTYQNRFHHNSVNSDFANTCGHQFYLLKAQQSIFDFINTFRRNSHTTYTSVTEENLVEGYAYKILKMVQLSSKLGKPVVMKPVEETEKESSKPPAIQQEKLALLDKIQPYGYYVEANISCSYGIKMSLNQVIETAADDSRLQKSTMSIRDASCQAPEMYNSIFGALWRTIDGHSANPQCKSLHEDEPVDFDSYKANAADLVNAIKSSMENKANAIRDLDEVIYHYNAKPNCMCNIAITHRLVMDSGLLPYLKSIARTIVASLKTKAAFGNYKISCLIVTGEFLYKWLEQSNSTYGEYIWIELQKAIGSELNNKQLCIHLMMMQSVVLEDNNLDFWPLKLEKYRQVFSKQYFLRILAGGVRNFQVYQDKGDHWVKVPITEQDEEMIWNIPLLAIEGKRDLKCSLKEKFYVVFGLEEADDFYCQIELLPLSLTNLDNVDTALSSKINVALISDLHHFYSSADIVKARSTFPLEVMIMPCSYLSAIDLRLRMGIDASANDPLRYDHIAYSERLTLQKI